MGMYLSLLDGCPYSSSIWMSAGIVHLVLYKSRWISFEVCLIIPDKMAMMFRFVRSVVFDIFQFLNMTCKSCMFPLPTILTLRDT